MEIAVKIRGRLPVLLLAVFALCLFGSPARVQAQRIGSTIRGQDPRSRGQNLVREKILHDASDRYDVKFLTTNTQRLGPRWIRVSGRGNFRRRGKPLQTFSYQVKVNPHNNDNSELRYYLR